MELKGRLRNGLIEGAQEEAEKGKMGENRRAAEGL